MLITILLVDDHDLVRAGVSRLLKDEPGLKVIGEVSSGEDAIKFALVHKPNVVLMDVKMPGIGGLEATRKMIRNDAFIKIIALTVFEEEPFPSKLLQAGAAGYLTKGADISEIVHAIKTVFSGKKYIGPVIAQQLALKNFTDKESSPISSLSERELQVMMMITSGLKVTEISDQLFLSPKTVNSYRYRLFEKLNISSDVELTHLAIRYGLLEMEKS
ncbi:MAG: sirA [Francisellaceae bacterium]|nr:sirA [Francisellaceae bacterium]